MYFPQKGFVSKSHAQCNKKTQNNVFLIDGDDKIDSKLFIDLIYMYMYCTVVHPCTISTRALDLPSVPARFPAGPTAHNVPFAK